MAKKAKGFKVKGVSHEMKHEGKRKGRKRKGRKSKGKKR